MSALFRFVSNIFLLREMDVCVDNEMPVTAVNEMPVTAVNGMPETSADEIFKITIL